LCGRRFCCQAGCVGRTGSAGWARLATEGANSGTVSHRQTLTRQTIFTRWIDDAAHSGLPAFITLAQQIDKHYAGIIAAVELGISNGLIEGINSKIRLINARGYGHHSARTLTSMIYLNLGGIDPKLPTQR
jgi:hypothetical protein